MSKKQPPQNDQDRQLMTVLNELYRRDSRRIYATLCAGEGLHPTSKGFRVRFSGKVRSVINGPFAETKELIAGFWIWQVKSLQEAIDWVKRCPNPHVDDCEVEIRQIFSPEDFGDAMTPELREREETLRAAASKK